MAANEAGDVPIESAGVRPSREDPPDLPEPPEIDKRIVFHPTQVAGLVMVGLLPLLSFFGLFGIGRGIEIVNRIRDVVAYGKFECVKIISERVYEF